MQAALSLYCSVFFFLFSQCHATIHLQPASVLKQQITVWALFVSGTTNCLFLIQALCLPATLSSHAHCLLPSSAPCYVWDAETEKEKGKNKKCREVARRYAAPAAKLAQSLPRDYGEVLSEAGSLLSPLPYNLIITSIWGWSDDCVLAPESDACLGKVSLPPLDPMMLKCQTQVCIFLIYYSVFPNALLDTNFAQGFGSLRTQQEESHSSIFNGS